ncbi:Hypothetical protein A7982_06173 [Minicystis rosea]|nr:Hypothetical protein A7982_06173 [Minicystis rosea]
MLPVLFGVMALFVVALVGFALWTRRGESRPDPPGVRSVATFRGGNLHILAEERAAEADEGRAALGKGLLSVLSDRLRAHGLSVDTPDRDDYGWGVILRAEGETAHLLLGAAEDEDAQPRWVLSVLDRAGGPGPRAVLAHVDTALHTIAGLEAIQWYERGDESAAAASPVDD